MVVEWQAAGRARPVGVETVWKCGGRWWGRCKSFGCLVVSRVRRGDGLVVEQLGLSL